MNFDEFALYIEGGSGKVLVPKGSNVVRGPTGNFKRRITVIVTTGCGPMVKFPLHFVVAGSANPSVQKVTSKVERFKNNKMAGTNGAKDKKRATDVKKATVPTGKKRTGKVADGTAGSQTDDDEGTDGEAEHGDLSGWGNGAGGPRAESGPPTLNGSDPQSRGL